MKYRPDIDGLRAVAVVSVVLYHAGFHQFPGGFAGVDIFFVISGYLITRLILQELGEQRFSIIAFYGRRARRILPALFVVLFFSSIAAYKLFLPPDMIHFGSSLLAVLFFCSNILFSNTTDYFAPAAEMTPLLHMWSLSVEEQFYIAYPVFLAIVTRYLPKRYIYLMATLLLLSIFWEIINLENTHETFYSTLSRAWELLLGGLVAAGTFPTTKSGIVSNLLGVSGLGVIGASLLIPLPLSVSYVFVTLGACSGAALVIHTGENRNSVISRALGTPPLVFIGLISYSLYLWHWVLLVFARFYLLHTLTSKETIAVVAVSVLLSIVSWAAVETPFRKITSRRLRAFSLGLAIISVCVLAEGGLLAHSTNGMAGRFKGRLEQITAGAKDIWGRWVECQYKVCRVGPPNTPGTFILWGDSHGGSIAPAIEQIANADHISGYVAFNPSCPPVVGLDNFDMAGHPCPPMADSVMSFIKAHRIKTVLLHASWSAYARMPSEDHAKPLPGSVVDYETRLKAFEAQMRKTLQELKSVDTRVILIASVPGAKMNVPTALARAFSATGSPDIPGIMYSYAEFMHREAAALDVLRRVATDYSIEIVFPHERLCDGEICLAAEGLVPFYTDDQHLTVHAAMLLAPMFANLLTSAHTVAAPHTP